MKFGINAQVIIALLGALYILMVCKEKYRIEYAEGEPVAVDERETEVYSMIRDGRLTPDEAADELANLRDAGVSLTSRSLSVLGVLGLADKEKVKKKQLPHKGPRPAVMPKPGSVDFIVKKQQLQHKGPRPAVMPKPGSVDFIVKKQQLQHKGARPAVMPKPGSVDFIVNKVRRADQPRPAVMPKPGSVVAVKAKKNSVAKAPIVAVKAEKNSIIEEEEEATIEGQVMIEEEGTIEGQAMIEEGMSTGAIAGITAVSIVALIAIMIMMRRLRR